MSTSRTLLFQRSGPWYQPTVPDWLEITAALCGWLTTRSRGDPAITTGRGWTQHTKPVQNVWGGGQGPFWEMSKVSSFFYHGPDISRAIVMWPPCCTVTHSYLTEKTGTNMSQPGQRPGTAVCDELHVLGHGSVPCWPLFWLLPQACWCFLSDISVTFLGYYYIKGFFLEIHIERYIQLCAYAGLKIAQDQSYNWTEAVQIK